MNYQRDTDAKIARIDTRLDTLEELSREFKQIKEWIDTVTKFTRIMEAVVCFVEKWTRRILKTILVIGATWAALKVGAADIKATIMGVIK